MVALKKAVEPFTGKFEVNTLSSLHCFENSIDPSRHAVNKLCDPLMGIPCHSPLRAESNGEIPEPRCSSGNSTEHTPHVLNHGLRNGFE